MFKEQQGKSANIVVVFKFQYDRMLSVRRKGMLEEAEESYRSQIKIIEEEVERHKASVNIHRKM